MNQRKNILARLKMSSRRRLFDGSYASVLRQWIFVLCLGIFLTAGSLWWSAMRFGYWSNLEERVSKENLPGTVYDQRAVSSIVKDYEDKSERMGVILNNIIPVATKVAAPENGEEGGNGVGDGLEDVSTTTATSTPSI